MNTIGNPAINKNMLLYLYREKDISKGTYHLQERNNEEVSQLSQNGPITGVRKIVVSLIFEFEWLFNATLTAEVISWRGRSDNSVAVGFHPKNSSSAGGALNHCATGPPP